MAELILPIFAAAGVVCVAAFAHRRGYLAGLARGYRLADQWRETALSLMNGRADQVDALREASIKNAQAAEIHRRRADNMGTILRNLGYTVYEVEDPDSGAVGYRAVMTQPAVKLPLGPSLS